MNIRTLPVVLAAVAMLVAACATEDPPAAGGLEGGTEAAGGTDVAGGDEAAGGGASLDCSAVEVIVPYSPGGGSDQQVRRVQPALEETLGTRLNITYQEGGDGSVGWNALANAEPDGCTIANVVMPNISFLSETAGGEVGFDAEDFQYVAFTEYSPNIIGVANDSEFQTIQDFVAAAEANPGEMTIAGVGAVGELLVKEVINATDMDVTYVPVSGGVGDIIPQVAGGHVDGAISGFSLLDGDQLRPIALSGADPHEDFPDVPTFEEAGYPGVQLVTTWGFVLPPETPDEVVEAWNGAVQQALQDESVQQAYEETGFIVLDQDVEETRSYFEEQHRITQEALGQ